MGRQVDQSQSDAHYIFCFNGHNLVSLEQGQEVKLFPLFTLYNTSTGTGKQGKQTDTNQLSHLMDGKVCLFRLNSWNCCSMLNSIKII